MKELTNFMRSERYTLFLDRATTFAAFVYPLTALPQLVEIWIKKNVAGVSLATWVMFMILTVPFILYSISKEDKKLTFMWSAWLLVYVGIISGVMLYR